MLGHFSPLCSSKQSGSPKKPSNFFLLRICGIFVGGGFGMTNHGRELGCAYDEQIELVGFRALLY